MVPVVDALHGVLEEFRRTWGPARAVAAPQIGVMKRLVYMHIDKPTVFINPVLTDLSEEMVTLWDDCMSFPELLVRVRRHRRCTITWRDLQWEEHRAELDELSELLQHEVDHLDGVLAISRAVDDHSIILRTERGFVQGPVVNDR